MAAELAGVLLGEGAAEGSSSDRPWWRRLQRTWDKRRGGELDMDVVRMKRQNSEEWRSEVTAFFSASSLDRNGDLAF